MLPRRIRSRNGNRRSVPRLALRPLVAGALVFLATACSDHDRLARPGLGPVTDGVNLASIVVHGTVRVPGSLAPASGGLVRTLVSRGTCEGGVVKRGPEAITDAAGEYRLEVVLDSPPFEGCVWLEVDFNLDTILPDTTVYVPGVKFGSGLPPRESIRIDVTLAAP